MNEKNSSKRHNRGPKAPNGTLHSAAGQQSLCSRGGTSGTEPLTGLNASVVPGSEHSSTCTSRTMQFSPALQTTAPSEDSLVGNPLPPKCPKPSSRSVSSSGLSRSEQERSSPGYVADEHPGPREAKEVTGKASISPNAPVSRNGSQPSKRDRLSSGTPSKTIRSPAHCPSPVNAFRSAKDTDAKGHASLLEGGTSKSSSPPGRLSSAGSSETNTTSSSPVRSPVKDTRALTGSCSFPSKRSDVKKLPSDTEGATVAKGPLPSDSSAVSGKKTSTAAQLRRGGATSARKSSSSANCSGFIRWFPHPTSTTKGSSAANHTGFPHSLPRSTSPPQRHIAGTSRVPNTDSPVPSSGRTISTIKSGAGRPKAPPPLKATRKSPSPAISASPSGSLSDERRFVSRRSSSFTGATHAGEDNHRLRRKSRGRKTPSQGPGQVETAKLWRNTFQHQSPHPPGAPATPRRTPSFPFASDASPPASVSPGVYSARDAFCSNASDSSSPIATSRTSTERLAGKSSSTRRRASSLATDHWLCKPALGVALIALAAFVTWALVKHRLVPPTALVAPVCDSPTCRYYASLLSYTMDADTHPCHDFYQHVCGRWTWDGRTSVANFNWANFLEEYMARIANRSSRSAGNARDATRDAARYIKACLVPLTSDNVDEVKQVLAAGGILWPLGPNNGRVDFLSALFHMAGRVGAPVFFDVTRTDIRGRTFVLFARDEAYEATYAKVTEHVNTLHAQDHYRACCEAFAGGPGNRVRCDELFDDFVRMKHDFDAYYAAQGSTGVNASVTRFLSYAPQVSKDRWATQLETYFSVALNDAGGVVIDDLGQFKAVFQLLERHGERMMLDLLGWLSVQVLIHYTNKGLMDSFYRLSDVANDEHHDRCFTTAYAAFGYALNRLFQEHIEVEMNRVKRIVQHRLRPAFRSLLQRGVYLLGSVTPEPTGGRLDRAFEIIYNTFVNGKSNSTHVFPELTELPLQNKMAISSYLKSPARVDARKDSQRPYLAYGAYDSTLIEGFRLNPQHFALPWYAIDAPRRSPGRRYYTETGRGHVYGLRGALGQLQRHVRGESQYAPYHVIDSPGFNVDVRGVCGEMLKAIASSLRTNYTIAFPPDSYWGLRKADGNWTGVLGMLQRDEADLAASVINPTSEKRDVAVETETILPIELMILAGRLSKHSSNIFGIIQVLTWEVWLLFGCSMVLSALLWSFSDWVHWGVGGVSTHRSMFVQAFGSHFWSFVESSCLEASTSTPKRFSARVVVGTFWLLVIVVTTVVAGQMKAMMMVREEADRIDSMRHLAARPAMKPYTVAGSAGVSSVRDSKDPDYQKVWRMMQTHKTDLPTSVVLSDQTLLEVVAGKAVLILSRASVAARATAACASFERGEFYLAREPMFKFNSVFYLNKRLAPRAETGHQQQDFMASRIRPGGQVVAGVVGQLGGLRSSHQRRPP
ncbi:hypothetical protein MTO96_008090 [Rhipicephalus appendiculatus]